jgi:hypothetical protein
MDIVSSVIQFNNYLAPKENLSYHDNYFIFKTPYTQRDMREKRQEFVINAS